MAVTQMLRLELNLDAKDKAFLQALLQVDNSALTLMPPSPPSTENPKCPCRSLADDLVKIKNLHNAILEAPPEMTPQLLAVFGQTLRRTRHEDSPLLALRIAQARVLNGEGCFKVAKEHGITDELTHCGLQLSAAMGPAVKAIADGQACHVIAQEIEILHAGPLVALEMLAVKGPAGDSIRRGESCLTVAKAYGIVQP
ncbi:hypothetical protein JZM24_09940 [Candidatus Sodalis endolongispinus]|uniref:Uncharacterized protein n=1 Tax=Candidatus Sodalis endolongispinus TaxID=2812662 RepID=A0ABS5YBM0_9GAMM|nr:hypothetical protein [Candidatus Sodalis endolongispinus]MBT9432367.1 hypothetical protein [Candidatus Sodalis endolongispinus]